MRRGADCLRQCEPDSASSVVFRGQKLKTERRARRSRRARSEARVAAPKNPPSNEGGFGAATRIRTGDLILTKDVLYQLSHSSIYWPRIFPQALIIISNKKSFVNRFFEKIFSLIEKI